MRRSALVVILLASSCAGMASAQDVVMRRPLPGGPAVSTPTATPTPTPTGTPTPTPTPTPTGTPTPTPAPNDPTTDPGFKQPPVAPPTDPVTKPVADYVVYYWDTTPWQGTSACGVQSEMTRTVTCMAELINWNADPMVTFKAVDPSLCVANGAGDPPSNAYSGKGAGCFYTTVFTSPTVWRLPTGDTGDVTCSADAYRTYDYRCVDGNGITVAKNFCSDNPTTGGSQNYDVLKTDYGNYAGCTAKWQATSQPIGCHVAGLSGSLSLLDAANAKQGPVYYNYVQADCVRSDGTYLYGDDQKECQNDGTAPSGPVSAGTCHVTYQDISQSREQYNYVPGSMGGLNGYCADSGTIVVKNLSYHGGDLGVDEQALWTQCYAAHATCTSTRVYLAENNLQFICTTGDPQKPSSASNNVNGYNDKGVHYYANSLLGPVFVKDQ